MEIFEMVNRLALIGKDLVMTAGKSFIGDDNKNARLHWASGAPTDGVAGFAVGCDYTDTASGDHYYNVGTTASASWKKVTRAS